MSLISWFNIDFIVCLVVITQSSVIIFQQIMHRKTVVQLIDRIMARNYGEIVQGQVLIKASEVEQNGIKVSLPDEELDPNGVDMLNKIL